MQKAFVSTLGISTYLHISGLTRSLCYLPIDKKDWKVRRYLDNSARLREKLEDGQMDEEVNQVVIYRQDLKAGLISIRRRVILKKDLDEDCGLCVMWGKDEDQETKDL